MELEEKQRLICIDYGLKRVGIAITDPLRLFAYPLTTLMNDSSFWMNLLKLLGEYSIEKIIVGYPLKEDGAKSGSTKLIEDFANTLKQKTKHTIEFFDERYSSEIAKERVIASVSSKKKRRNKALIDQNAAAVILEDYLNKSV